MFILQVLNKTGRNIIIMTICQKKLMPLEAEGNIYEPGSTINKELSASYTKRREMMTDENKYKDDGGVFIGQIFHDMLTNESG